MMIDQGKQAKHEVTTTITVDKVEGGGSWEAINVASEGTTRLRAQVK